MNATPDGDNVFVVGGKASLFNHAGNDHRMKLNKAAATDTASQLFQSGFTGHAEIGLSGSIDLTVKVSPDGQAWSEALRFDARTGRVRGTAVQSAANDATAGRLMTTGAFGLGGSTVLSGDASALAVSGIYDYQTASGSTGGPAGVTSGQLWHAVRAGGTGASQILAATDRVHTRARSGPNWQPWRSLEPERGSNANGSYTRFPDGTQVCTSFLNDTGTAWGTQVATGFFTRVEPLTWVFPVPFAATPSVTANATFVIDRRVCGVGLRAGDATAILLQPWTSGAMIAADAKSINVMAVGRWY